MTNPLLLMAFAYSTKIKSDRQKARAIAAEKEIIVEPVISDSILSTDTLPTKSDSLTNSIDESDSSSNATTIEAVEAINAIGR